jgi:hypothetical protein
MGHWLGANRVSNEFNAELEPMRNAGLIRGVICTAN